MKQLHIVVNRSEHDSTALQVRIHVPDKILSDIGVIIAHPYGPLGGNMENNVILALETFFNLHGYVTMCYNARGVGESGGRTSWTGTPEEADAVFLCKYLLNWSQKELASKPLKGLVLCGYSYGAMILSAARREMEDSLVGLIAISYPISVGWAITMFNTSYFTERAFNPVNGDKKLPVLFIYGDQDQMTSKRTFQEFFADKIPEPKYCVEVKGGDHFWFGTEKPILAAVDAFVTKLT